MNSDLITLALFGLSTISITTSLIAFMSIKFILKHFTFVIEEIKEESE